MSLVHLHRHSEFSFLDGVGTAEHYAKRAAELGQSALAITDHGSLAGALYHVNACEEHGIKPIVGMEAYFTQDAKVHDKDHKRFHLVLLAKNQEGFKNLMRLSSLSWMPENFYYRPCVDWSMLRKHSEGLIASTSCLSGIIPRSVMAGDTEGARHYVNVMQDIFGDDFYFEIQPHDEEGQQTVNLWLKRLAAEKGIPLVAAADAHFPYLDWADTQDVLVMISTGQSNKSREEREELAKNVFKFSGNTYWLMSEQELKDNFKEFHLSWKEDEIDEAIKNTQEIADRCDDFTIDKSPKIPKATKSPLEAERIIREWCKEGLERIGKLDDSEYIERMEREISVMRKLRVLDYFVVVGDMVRWAKDQGIRVGPGRGSAVGSLVNYLIRITAVDPIGYGLLFERFLNEHRSSMPDIDVDFQSDKRDVVKEYLHERWGEDYVVNISSFQSFDYRAAISDIARVLDVPFAEAKSVTKLIPKKTWNETFESLEESIPKLKEFFKKYPKVKTHAFRLHGQIRGLSQHAGAVIITDKPFLDVIPVMKAKDGNMVTQWSERANAQLISPYGFLKIDCLATDGLRMQAETIKRIEERTGKKIDFEDIEQFPVIESPYNVDEKVVDLFSQGTNLGVFQFASKQVVGLLRQIKPTNLEHIIAANALNRPGTLANGVAFDYAKRKNGLQNWKLPHESLEEYIGLTYGFMIFQEQVMQIFQALGKDVSPSETDVFLKVVAKGIARDLEGKQRLQKYYDQFAAGCEERGMSKESYDLVWDQILEMTTYSFNKSHSTGYGVQAYQDAWLKTYYLLDFYASLLSTEMKSSNEPQKKVSRAIKEASIMGVKILPPNINSSDVEFTIDHNSVRFGLQAIKYVGEKAVEEIKLKRPFSSWEDFCERVEKKQINKRVKLALYNAGAFDEIGGRSEWIVDEDLSSSPGAMTDKGKSLMEKEHIGFSLSMADGVDIYKDMLMSFIERDGVAGEIVNVKPHKTKKGEDMAFVDIVFGPNEFSATFFPEQYESYRHILTEGNVILVIGEQQDDYDSVVVSRAISAAQLASELEESNASR